MKIVPIKRASTRNKKLLKSKDMEY